MPFAFWISRGRGGCIIKQMSNDRHFAAIGRPEGQPTLSHMNQSPASAERLWQRRETE